MSSEELCFRHSLPLKLIDLKNSVFILMCEKCERETIEKKSIDELLQQLKIVVSNQSEVYKEQHQSYLNQFTEMKRQIKILKEQLDQCDVLINQMLDQFSKNLSYFEGLQIQIESCKQKFNLHDFENLMQKVSYNNDTKELNLKESLENNLDIQEDLSRLQDEIHSLKKTNKKFSKSIKLVAEKQINESRFIKLKENPNAQHDPQQDNQEFLWNENPYLEPIEQCLKLTDDLLIARTKHLILCFNIKSSSVISCKNPINITSVDKITQFGYFPVPGNGQKFLIFIAIDNGYIEQWELVNYRMNFLQAQKVSNKKGNVKFTWLYNNEIALIAGDRLLKFINLITLELKYYYPTILLNSNPQRIEYAGIKGRPDQICISGNEIVFVNTGMIKNSQNVKYFEPNQQFSSKIKYVILTQYGALILTEDLLYDYIYNSQDIDYRMFQKAENTMEIKNQLVYCQNINLKHFSLLFVCGKDNEKFNQFYFQLSRKIDNINTFGAKFQSQLEKYEVNKQLQENQQIKHVACKIISAYYNIEFYYTNGHDLIIKTHDERWDENQNVRLDDRINQNSQRFNNNSNQEECLIS